MRKNVLLLVVSIALVFTGCNKTKTDIDSSPSRTFKMSTDLTTLSQRFTVVNEPIQWTNYLYKSSQLNPVSFNEAWRLQAYQPAGSTDTLSVSCVDALNGYVYIGSHLNNYKVTPAEAWGGEIAIVDVTGATPSLIGSAYDPITDYNDMEITSADPNNLWIAGETNNRGAVIYRVGVPAPGFVSAGPALEMSIFGTSGNSITRAGADLWVSSATHPTTPTVGGGLLAINANFPAQTNHTFSVAQAKQFDADGTHGVLLYGSSPVQSYIRVYDMNNLYSYVDFPLVGYDVTNLGKNAVDVSQGFAYLAMGDDGVIKVDLTTGAVVNHFQNFGKGLANGVKVDGTYVYVAYGQGGFYLLDKTDLSAVGHWDTVYSCNYVAIDPVELPATSNHVYLANGRAGLICLERI
jgi:hypothetical protein